MSARIHQGSATSSSHFAGQSTARAPRLPLAWARGRFGLLGAALAAALLAGAPVRAGDAAGGIAEKPLAPHLFPRGKTMFMQLPAEATGVRTENRYNDPRMWGDLYQEFEDGSIGTGVAIG